MTWPCSWTLWILLLLLFLLSCCMKYSGSSLDIKRIFFSFALTNIRSQTVPCHWRDPHPEPIPSTGWVAYLCNNRCLSEPNPGSQDIRIPFIIFFAILLKHLSNFTIQFRNFLMNRRHRAAVGQLTRVAYISEDISSVSYIWLREELIENQPGGHVGHLKDSVRYEASSPGHGTVRRRRVLPYKNLVWRGI